MENQEVLTFSLSPAQLKYKDILNKDFLELEIYAISDINPNRNKTHFTPEGLINGAKTFKNKPIVGFFNKGDFEEHNGVMANDSELDNAYWNVDNGERILGFIRESDTVEVVPWNGQNWIRLTCVLCIRYCYKQAKKLLKDRHKKVSVEIITTESEYDEQGIRHIKNFNLQGITILGSKNGRPVLEAIPDAHASILAKIDDAVLENQKEILCFAYKDYDDAQADINNSNKEESAVDKEQFSVDNAETNATNPTDQECNTAAPEQECNNSVTDTDCNSAPDSDEACKNSVSEDCPEGDACTVSEECSCDGETKCNSGCSEQECDGEKCSSEEGDGCCKNSTEHDANCECAECLLKKCKALEAQCGEYTARIAELEKQLEGCCDYSEIKARMEKAEAELHTIHCNELKMKAAELMADQNLSEEVCKSIEDKCCEGKYSSEEELERDVAFAIYKAHARNSNKEEYSVNIVNPTENKNTHNKQPDSRKERLANYAKGRK